MKTSIQILALLSISILLETTAANNFTVKVQKNKVKRVSKTKFGVNFDVEPYMYVFTESGRKEPLIMSGSNPIINIVNNNELAYTGPIYVGSQQA
jgi:hypothetical protein